MRTRFHGLRACTGLICLRVFAGLKNEWEMARNTMGVKRLTWVNGATTSRGRFIDPVPIDKSEEYKTVQRTSSPTGSPLSVPLDIDIRG